MLKLGVGRLAAFAAMSALVSVASAAEVTRTDLAKSEIGWRGAQLGDWAKRPYQCRDVRVAGDVLAGVVTGRDPQLNAKLAKPLVAKGNHVAHFRLRVPTGGRCQLFWIGEGDKGASETRQRSFYVRSGEDWRDYRVPLDWCSPTSVVALRFDLPPEMEGKSFEIGEIRIVEEGACVDVRTEDFAGIAFSLQMPPGVHYCSVVWGGEAGKGSYFFSPATDGARHDYWFDLRRARFSGYGPNRGKPCWRGGIVNYRVEQTKLGLALPVENLRLVKAKPDLPADVTVTSARPASAIPRAGRPLDVEVVVRNYGTRPAENLRFAFDSLPSGVRVVDAGELAPAEALPGSEGHETHLNEFRYNAPPPVHERVYRLRLSDPPVGTHRFGLTVTADGCAARRTEIVAVVKPSLGLQPADYPPEPRPVSTAPYEVGALIFPGWDAHVWNTVWERAPWRKPVLGWYDETKPETIDWQIRQLVENGISYVLVDWYWNRWNHAKISHNWPDVFKRAKYRKYLKWSVMWANHNPPGAHTAEDQAEVTQFWVDNYFCDPQYQTIDGMPVVTIYCPDNMERDMKGKGGCKEMLAISQRVAKAAGYKGIYFIGMRGPDREEPEFLKKFADWGFRRTCVYRYLGTGVGDAPSDEAGNRPYRWIADTSLRHWRRLKANTTLPFMPSLSTSWDNRPWCGEGGWAVTGYTVADFTRVCRDAKAFSDETGERMLLVGPLDEWGEGEIGYPNAEHGYGTLEAVRDTFGRKPAGGWPVNFAPEDVGLVCPQMKR